MGVYLSAPVTDKHSIDRSCKICTYGASSMQGWRLTQEDAHNCIPDYDSKEDSAFFAVYDGHGGAEVAQYCAMHLPDFIQTMPEYKEKNLEEALKVAFLKFDGTLTEETVVRELRRLAGNQTEEEDPEVEKHEAEMLRAEADMPLEDLLGQYGQGVSPPPSKPRNRRQFLSPIIRTKRPIFPGEGSSASDPEDHSTPQEMESDGSVKAEDSQGSQDINSSSSAQEPDMGGDRLEDKLINGHADNDNNLNIEREIKGSMEEEATPTPDTSVGSSSSGDGQSRGEGRRGVDRDSSADGACEVTDSTCIKQSRDSTVNETGDVSSTTDGNLVEMAESNRKDDSSDKAQEPQDGEAASSSSSKQKPDEETPTSAGSSKGKMRRQKASSDVDGGVASSQSSSGVRQSFAEALDKDTLDDCEDDSDDSNWEDMPDDEDDDDDDDDEEEEEDEEEEAEDGDEDEDEEGEYVEGEEYEEEDDEEDDDDDATYMLGSEDGHMDMTSEEPGSGSGCTACVAMIVGRRLVVANAGDSRCVLCRNNQAVDLSFDHKPEDEPEKSRIEKAGGKVTTDGRVNGGLNLSRAIGDHVYKQNKELPDREQMITALPDIQSVTLTDADEFMVLACDGIWWHYQHKSTLGSADSATCHQTNLNFMTSEQVVQFVKERMQDPEKRKKLSKICEELFDHCLAPNTFGDGTGCDNMTCIIVDLKRTKADCNSLGDNKRAPDEEDLPCSSAEKRRKIEDCPDASASSSSLAACSSSTSSSS